MSNVFDTKVPVSVTAVTVTVTTTFVIFMYMLKNFKNSLLKTFKSECLSCCHMSIA